MYERMLDKGSEPVLDQIKEHMGSESFERLSLLEGYLQAHYHLSKELRFPFGSGYGWGYKYGHRSTHLCYAFFEKGAFTVTVQIGDGQARSAEDTVCGLSLKAQELWAGRYPCGNSGGWVHYRVLSDEELDDVYALIGVKKTPVRQ
jgi:hypothetical protein